MVLQTICNGNEIKQSVVYYLFLIFDFYAARYPGRIQGGGEVCARAAAAGPLGGGGRRKVQPAHSRVNQQLPLHPGQASSDY